MCMKSTRDNINNIERQKIEDRYKRKILKAPMLKSAGACIESAGV